MTRRSLFALTLLPALRAMAGVLPRARIRRPEIPREAYFTSPLNLRIERVGTLATEAVAWSANGSVLARKYVLRSWKFTEVTVDDASFVIDDSKAEVLISGFTLARLRNIRACYPFRYEPQFAAPLEVNPADEWSGVVIDGKGSVVRDIHLDVAFG